MGRREFLRTVGVAAIASGVAYWAGRRSRLPYRGQYVQLGTSLTSGIGTQNGDMTPAIVGEKLGLLAINGACPGACAGTHKFPSLDPVSLYSLTEAITSGDWSAQQKNGEAIRDGAISRLMSAHFPSVSLVGLEYGTNDFRFDRPIGTDADESKETFKGALNHSIRALQHVFPNLRVFLITPSYIPTVDERDSDENPNVIGAFLKDYVDAMLDVAALNRVPCLDLWRTSGINRYNYKDFTLDGLHPNDNGISRRSHLIASFIGKAVS